MPVCYAFRLVNMDGTKPKHPFVVHTGDKIVAGGDLHPSALPSELGGNYASAGICAQQALSYEPPFELLTLFGQGTFRVKRLSPRERRKFEDAVKRTLEGK